MNHQRYNNKIFKYSPLERGQGVCMHYLLRRLFSLFIVNCSLLILLSSCKKDPPTISITPHIEFVGASSTSILEYQDILTLTISYTDGDGDLGENNPDVHNLFVVDNRIGITYPYRISELAPDNANIPIKGNLEIKLPGIGITDGSTSQSVTYSIYVLDRQRVQSNTVTSPSITIHQ